MQTGTREETRTTQELTGYTKVMRTREVPVYETVSETATRAIQIAEEYVRTERVPAQGVIFLQGNVRKMAVLGAGADERETGRTGS